MTCTKCGDSVSPGKKCGCSSTCDTGCGSKLVTCNTYCGPVAPDCPTVVKECPNAPVKMGVEDLTWGCDTEVQLRHCKNVKITQINADHILYCPSGLPVSFYLGELKRMFPYIECQVGRPTMDWDNWDDACIACTVDCCFDGADPTVCTRIAMHEGDVVKHHGCLWISLVDKNYSEPGKDTSECLDDGHGNVTKPKWLCLSKIGCRLDAIEKCMICDVVDTNTVDLTKLPNPNGPGNIIKGDVKIDHTVPGNIINVGVNGLSVVAPPNDGLPAGAVTFVDTIPGTFSIVVNGTPTYSGPDDPNVSYDPVDYYEFLPSEKTFKVSDYPYLGTAGNKLVLSMNASIGYYTNFNDSTTLRTVNPYQWGTAIYVDGVRQFTSANDAYALNKSGHNSGLSDNGSLHVVTTGKDLVVKFVYVLVTARGDAAYHLKDSLEVDMGSATISFSADGS